MPLIDSQHYLRTLYVLPLALGFGFSLRRPPDLFIAFLFAGFFAYLVDRCLQR